MELRNWVQDRFGGTGQTLLDEDVYSHTDIRKDITKLEHKLKKLENEMDQHSRTYKKLLKEGAEVSDLKRKKYAQKAKFEKKKYAIKKKKYRANSVKLGTILSIQGMREIMEVQNEDDIALDNAMDDADAQEIQSEIMERMAAFGIEMEDMEEIQEALDIPIMEDDIAMDVSEEEQLMQEMAASEISEEQVDIEMEAEVSADTSDDAAIEDDLDLEEVEIDEQEFDI
ncbi:hypothetical protein [Natronolimnobius baerhuensis]|uniref:Uncharacterized protein n=1 Tax=Natronolimnobius baerhuensis TaxID=253108 RepID=A0A202E4J6_9EURY|nr:hypothetical protein [Natronolimnobius baerhuensis]OVE82830.1 hypothetical protein B2G88_18730 [Natronolimnobius baerhuensis]